MFPVENNVIKGQLTLELWDEHGNLKERQVYDNLVTTAGDKYIAQQVANLSPSPGAPTGMKLGTGSTAVAKSGAGAALVTYLSGTNAAFSPAMAANAVAGTDTGWTMDAIASWAAGVGTGTLTEAVIVNDSASDATSTAANTYSRVLISITKAAGDTLTGTWKWKFLGA